MITFDQMTDAMMRTGIPFAVGGWKRAKELVGDYGVIALDSELTLFSDNRRGERIMEGTIDLFAIENRGTVNARRIEEVLDEAGAPWSLNLPGKYEPDTGYTHWEWVFRCLP